MDTIENLQGRARGLYDEQLQRQKQEKLLFRQPIPADAATRAVAPADRETPST